MSLNVKKVQAILTDAIESVNSNNGPQTGETKYDNSSSDENNMCDYNFSSENKSSDHSFKGILGGLIDGIKRIIEAVKEKIKEKDYSGLPNDIHDAVGQFSSNLYKMPSGISNTISKVSDMFKNNSVRKEDIEDGTNECIETYDEHGVQTGGYGIVKHNNGNVEIHYDGNFENGKPVSGHGVNIMPGDKVISYYDVVYEYDGEGNQKATYTVRDFSYDGTKLKEYTYVEENKAK